METDAQGRPLKIDSLRDTGLLLLRSRDLFLLLNDGERVAMLTANELANLFDQSWRYLIDEGHPILQQPLPSALWKQAGNE